MSFIDTALPWETRRDSGDLPVVHQMALEVIFWVSGWNRMYVWYSSQVICEFNVI